MCGGGGGAPHDNSAELARQEEARRQERIAAGTANIESKFAGFNDDFYKKYQDDYTGYYFPQLEDQYGDARKKLTLALAKTGNLMSSAGTNQMGDLQEFYNNQRTGITNQGINARNQFTADVDNMKSQLYSDNRGAADPGSAAAAAAAAASQLQPGLPQSPLANAFADFFNTAGNAAAIYGKSAGNTKKPNTGVQDYNTGGGQSSRVIQ